jgi:chromosome partitioning protein
VDWEKINPTILGVLFTMIQIRSQQPISTQQQYIEQIKQSPIPHLDTFIRENKTSYGDAPEYGVPVVIKRVTGKTYLDVQRELEDLTTEVLGKV